MVSPFKPSSSSHLSHHVTAIPLHAYSQSDQKVREAVLPIFAQGKTPIPLKTLPPMRVLPSIPEEAEALSDYDLFQLMHALGYKSDDQGICAGVAGMGGQAILADDFKTFEERLERIGRLVQQYKEQGGDLQEMIQKDKASLEKDHDLMAFLEGIELYHQINLYPHLSMEKMPSSNAHVAKNLKIINAIGLSSKLKSEGGVSVIQKIAGMYTESDLIQYFALLKPLFIQEKPLTLTLDSCDHRVTVGYDKKTDSWLLINAADLTNKRLKEDKDIAKAIYESFEEPNEPSSYIALATYMEATRKDQKALQKEIAALQAKAEFQLLHSLSREKRDLILSGKTSFLDLLLIEPELSTFEFLLNQKIALNTKTGLGHTILGYAAVENNLDGVRLLLDKGADPNIATKKGHTPLDIAVHAENLEMAQLLLEKGTKPKPHELQIMLCLSVQKGNLALAKLLIKYGALPNIPIDRGRNTPLRLAVILGNTEMVELLIDQGAFLHPYGEDKDLLFLSLEKHPEIFKKLIKNRADVNVKDKEGNTLLAQAVDLNSKELVQFLLESGADAKLINNEGNAPLHIAARKGLDEVVSLLLPKSDMKKLNNNRKSALYLARENKNFSTAKVLAKAGAKLSFFDRIKLFFKR